MNFIFLSKVKIISLLSLLCFYLNIFAQSTDKINTRDSDNNKRVSFVFGPGFSYSLNKIIDIPVISPTNNHVILNNASRATSNLSVGIVYTPFVYNLSTARLYTDSLGNTKSFKEYERVAYKWTYALFYNPLALSQLGSSETIFSKTDFGIGFGYRFTGGMAFFVCADFGSIRTPREWFINSFANNNTQYIIDNQIQKSIDLSDNTIFTNKFIMSIGFKVCYTFDIIKSFSAKSTSFSEFQTIKL